MGCHIQNGVHTMFVPKYEWKTFYAEKSLEIGTISLKLCKQKLVVVKIFPDHIHTLL